MLLLKACLSSIPDPRRAQGKGYDLSHLLLFRILAVLSGATAYRKIQRFIHARRQWLNALCGLSWKRAPSRTSIRYTLPGLPVEAVERAFRQQAAHLARDLPEVPQIALDGTALRGSCDRFEDQKAI